MWPCFRYFKQVEIILRNVYVHVVHLFVEFRNFFKNSLVRTVESGVYFRTLIRTFSWLFVYWRALNVSWTRDIFSSHSITPHVSGIITIFRHEYKSYIYLFMINRRSVREDSSRSKRNKISLHKLRRLRVTSTSAWSRGKSKSSARAGFSY